MNTDRNAEEFIIPAKTYPPPRLAITLQDASTLQFYTFAMREVGYAGAAYFLVHPDTQAQLDRIEHMLKQLLGEVEL